MNEMWRVTKKGAYIYYVSAVAVVLSCYILYCDLSKYPWEAVYPLLIGILFTIAIGVGAVSLQLIREPSAQTQARLQSEELTRQIALANEQARQFECAKEQFLTNINHELRTPLTVVHGYFELLQSILEQNGSLEYEKHATYMHNAVSCCEDLCLIVNTILQNIDINYCQVPVQSQVCSVEKIIQESCALLDITEQQRQRIQLQIIPDLMAYVDVQCLHRILYQILNNAFKYTPENSPIMIHAEQYTLSAKHICISIIDRGPGIPIEEQKHIFDEFVRLPRNVASNVRGTGLGLSICQQLIKSIQGKIWVESAGIDGLGSCFRFTLPMALDPAREHISQSEEAN